MLSQCKHQSENSITQVTVSITVVNVVQSHALKPCIHICYYALS